MAGRPGSIQCVGCTVRPGLQEQRFFFLSRQAPQKQTGWFIWPFKGVIGGLGPFKKGLRTFFIEISSRKLYNRKLPENHLQTLQNTSLKLFPSTPKLQINQPETEVRLYDSTLSWHRPSVCRIYRKWRVAFVLATVGPPHTGTGRL